MNYEFNLEILKELDIFSELDSSAIRKLCKLFEEKIFNQGEIIFEEGSVDNSMMSSMLAELK